MMVLGVNTHTIASTCSHTPTHTPTHTCTHTQIHTHIHTHTQTHRHIQVHTHVHTHTHMYIHTHMSINTETYLSLTWKCSIMVHINPRVSLGFPSVMSSFRMFTSLTWGEPRRLDLNNTSLSLHSLPQGLVFVNDVHNWKLDARCFWCACSNESYARLV